MFSKILNLKNGLQFYTLLVIISAIMFTVSFNKIPHLKGDGHEYYMMAESFVNHGTFDLREEDRKSAEVKAHIYPYKSCYINRDNHPGYFQSLNGKYYSYHFWAYSLLTVPAKYICNLLEVNDLKSFQLTNAILFILMIWLLYFNLKLPGKQKNALILLLIFNPILYYLNWTHAEVFTYVFAVLSLMYYLNKSYKTSYVLMAIASWQNPPAIFFSLLVFTAHSFQYFKEKNYKKIIKEGLALSPFLLPMIFYFYNYRVLNLIAAKGYCSVHFISWDKIWDLYFGLQHGMILFSAIVIIAFIYLAIRTIVLRNFTITTILLLLSIILMSIIVTTALNWNCGMAFIIRYATWIYAFIVFFIVLSIGDTLKLRIITVSNTLLFLIMFFSYTNFSPVCFNELSKYVLDNYPAAYITTKDTFRENVLHKETGLNYSKPIVYKDSNNNIRKMLISYAELKKLLKDPKIFVDDKYKKYLLEHYKDKKGAFFINIQNGMMGFNNFIEPAMTSTFNADNVTFLGWSHAEATHRWSLGKSSKIRFKIKNKTKFKGILHLHFGTLGEQEIKIYLNDKHIGDIKANGWDIHSTIKFDPKVLNEDEINIVRFKYSNPHKPNNGDPRVLAMALKVLRFE